MSGRKENKWLNSDDLWGMGLPDRWAHHTSTFPFGYFCITWLFFKERIHLFYDLIIFVSIYYSNTWKSLHLRCSTGIVKYKWAWCSPRDHFYRHLSLRATETRYRTSWVTADEERHTPLTSTQCKVKRHADFESSCFSRYISKEQL